MNKKIPGPIAIFGVGGLIGFNLFRDLITSRTDVYGLSHDPANNWRLKTLKKNGSQIIKCNILNIKEIENFIVRYRPQTIFNLAAYGAYSNQTDPKQIYKTNFDATFHIIETLKKNRFSIYIHAGSQSEYGLNCDRPDEESKLIPNSHYAVSKVASYYLLKYYACVEKLPLIHVRFYSVYGQFEEPTRLIPTLLRSIQNNTLPNLVDPNISRDFVYIDDVVKALQIIASNSNKANYGQAYNIASGRKTTIKKLVTLAIKIFKVQKEPIFSTMKNRSWDLINWVGDTKKMKDAYGWSATTALETGLRQTYKLL
ncbi:hypothetical protein A3C23_00750 [Candidatus Roizmanbacteria bacterium RIFCSPHIGHO2_02_FULL_37_13b]|uniref:NAD-dependent epimerase/dehydratase domain-containing protein n=1 Tax=Candidatus Roizmanbacteria bacterium RIFCSPLOWO2_02_FULL_36_11 TaxID=1802071 RepID=A0A1F7JD54_9BACT|nr:MAG: hypothetical protein A3C23_00750 [Candidatus Roizmanbacteria bacterium RIFCSPHIGHO2_02_FULL_37_13b]OGK53526.1 MAG: hypothetical protein A3H78_04860 [Candidatus Roizmanbacteria bacterium RIFCSPLOWO2_02_FULL_36_11]